MADQIFLDFNSTTPVRAEVLKAMEPYWSQVFGNPSSVHQKGQESKNALEKARWEVAQFLGASSADEIVFTSGGSEANVLAVRGIVGVLSKKFVDDPLTLPSPSRGEGLNDGDHILSSPIEHDSILSVLTQLKEEGAAVEFLSVDADGLVSPNEVREKIRPDTKLVIVMMANNEVGTIQPVEEIGVIAREAGVAFHVDAVQAAGKIPVDVKKLGSTTVSISGHKIGAPKGIGALYIREKTKIRPLFPGHQQGGRRAGTENTAFAVGLAAACRLAKEDLSFFDTTIRQVRDYFERSVLDSIPDAKRNGHPTKRVPNTTNISFGGVKGDELLIALDLAGVAVSTGSSCASGSTKASAVLSAMGLDPQYLLGSLRFSLGRTTKQEDLDQTLEVLKNAVLRLRQSSRIYAKNTTVPT